MSLNITFYDKSLDSGIHYTRQDGSTVEIDDIDSSILCELASISITHSLYKMAEHIPILNTNLYEVLWHGDELPDPIIKGKQFDEYLYDGISFLLKKKKYLMQYNPDNDCGNYDSLLQFTKDCLSLSIQHPNADVRFSR